MKVLFLSYRIDNKSPAYGGGDGFQAEIGKNINAGDTCNTQVWHLPNHLGTHIDAPAHFSNSGLSIDQYSPDFWICERPYLVELKSVKKKEIITPQHLRNLVIPIDIDLLLVKTGFGLKRQAKPFTFENPGFSPDLADYLRENFPQLKMIGFDVISLSSYAFREIGKTAHLRFLDHEKPILPIEDMDLTTLEKGTKLKRVVISPLRIQGADAAPCTVFAELYS
jgi:arylformamidase